MKFPRDLPRFCFEHSARITRAQTFGDVLLEKAAKAEPFILRRVRELVKEQALIPVLIRTHEDPVTERQAGGGRWSPIEFSSHPEQRRWELTVRRFSLQECNIMLC